MVIPNASQLLGAEYEFYQQVHDIERTDKSEERYGSNHPNKNGATFEDLSTRGPDNRTDSRESCYRKGYAGREVSFVGITDTERRRYYAVEGK